MTTSRWLRSGAGVAVALSLVVLGACKSPEERNADSQTTDAPITEELGPGVTEDTITLGVMYLDLSVVKDVLPSLDHGDYETAFEAMATSINDAGGINGRDIELVFAEIDPVDQSTAAAACTQLTEDQELFAVLTPQANATASQCVVVDHATPLIGGVQTLAELEAAEAPWFTWDAASSSAAERTVAAVLDDGGFDGKRVAVVAPAADEQVATDTADQLRDAGVDVTGVAVSSATLSDTTAALAEMQTFAERFRSDGADSVVVIGEAFVLFAQSLQQSDYRPEMVATSTRNVLGFLVSASDTSMLDGLVAGGPPDEQTAFQEPPAQECIDAIKAVDPDRIIDAPQGAKDGEPDTFVSVVQACKALDLFAAIATKAGQNLNAATFGQAGDELGEITLPMLGGPSDYSAEHTDGNPPMFLARWGAASGELVYSDTPIP
jgi:ABC-type branched-subunit amino acid transport system substrate-binding protein